MSILTKVIDKKESGKIKTEDEKVYKSKHLGEDIIIEKKPMSQFLEIIKECEGENEAMMLNYLIYAFCPMFQDPDGVKQAMDYYKERGAKLATPRELPEYIFDSNMTEMGDIAEIITSFYNVDELGEDVKN